MNGIGSSWKLIVAGAIGVTALVAAHFAGEESASVPASAAPVAQPALVAPPSAAHASPAAGPANANDEELDGPLDPSPAEDAHDAPQDKPAPDEAPAEADGAGAV